MERFHNSSNEIQKQSTIEVGILTKRKNGMLSPVFKNCIVFPIKNKEGRIINVYGRSIIDNKNAARHFYLKGAHRGRSEEHTSELQSRPHLVCRLLLEKKKKNKFENPTELLVAIPTVQFQDPAPDAVSR